MNAARRRPAWLREARSVRVAIVSDTHGEVDPRVCGVAAGCEIVVHAGDVGGDAVLEALDGDPRLIVAVRGNNDDERRWQGTRERLAALPDEAAIDLPGGRLVVVHGHRAGRPATRHATLRDRYPQARAVVYGHSHRRCVDRSRRPWILNPGAAGRARTFGGPSLLVLVAGEDRWRIRERRFEPGRRPRRGA